MAVKYKAGSKVSDTEDTMLTRIKEVRTAHSLSQRRMGERLGIPWRTYQNYEVGSRTLSVDFVTKIIDVFELDSDWFLFGNAGRSS